MHWDIIHKWKKDPRMKVPGPEMSERFRIYSDRYAELRVQLKLAEKEERQGTLC